MKPTVTNWGSITRFEREYPKVTEHVLNRFNTLVAVISQFPVSAKVKSANAFRLYDGTKKRGGQSGPVTPFTIPLPSIRQTAAPLHTGSRADGHGLRHDRGPPGLAAKQPGTLDVQGGPKEIAKRVFGPGGLAPTVPNGPLSQLLDTYNQATNVD